jgi:acyl dehydratase
MSVKTIPLEKMKSELNKELGVTDWFQIDQETINRFADSTMDWQWIHTDEKAAAKGPFGKTIAHGFLTVSLLSHFGENHMIIPKGYPTAIDHGMNKVRLLAPVKVGSKIRDRISLKDFEEKDGGILVTTSHSVEIQNQEKPALFAETLTMFYPA